MEYVSHFSSNGQRTYWLMGISQVLIRTMSPFEQHACRRFKSVFSFAANTFILLIKAPSARTLVAAELFYSLGLNSLQTQEQNALYDYKKFGIRRNIHLLQVNGWSTVMDRQNQESLQNREKFPEGISPSILFDRVYREYRTAVLLEMVKVTRDWHMAEEITQVTFMKAWLSWSTLRNFDKVQFWLFRIAKHTYLDLYRQAKRKGHLKMIPIQTIDDAVIAFESQHDPQDTYSLQEAVRSTLSKMPALQRTVLILAEQEEWSYDEISERLHLSLNAVRMRLWRAREEFRCAYQNFQHSPVSETAGMSSSQEEVIKAG